MKKNVYLLAVLMIALSCVCWTGCSDSDDGPETPPEIPGDTIPPVDTIAPIDSLQPFPTDTLWLVKSVKIDDSENRDGFFKMINLVYAEGVVSKIEIIDVSKNSKGEELRDSVAIDVTRENGRIEANFFSVEDGDMLKAIYTLDGKGLVTKGELLYAADNASKATCILSNNAISNMLETIMDEDSDYGMTYFDVTYSPEKNWSTYVFDGEGINCTASDQLNNYSIDLNLLAFTFGMTDADLIDYAILAGLFPKTTNVVSKISIGGESLAWELTTYRGRVQTLQIKDFGGKMTFAY